MNKKIKCFSSNKIQVYWHCYRFPKSCHILLYISIFLQIVQNLGASFHAPKSSYQFQKQMVQPPGCKCFSKHPYLGFRSFSDIKPQFFNDFGTSSKKAWYTIVNMFYNPEACGIQKKLYRKYTLSIHKYTSFILQILEV